MKVKNNLICVLLKNGNIRGVLKDFIIIAKLPKYWITGCYGCDLIWI
jgi:hypothetical protein